MPDRGCLGLGRMWTVCALFVSLSCAALGGDVAKREHPFLLWTAEDLAAMRRTIEKEPWAARAYEELLEPKRHCRDLRELFRFAVMGDRDAGDSQKKKLLRVVNSQHPFGSALEWRLLAYDLLYDEFTPEEHAKVEKELRRYISYAIKPGGTYDTSVYNNERNYARYDGEDGRYTKVNWLPNIIFPWKISANLAATVLRDEKLIRDTWAVHGSIKWYFDEYLSDLGFYHEEFSKMGATPGALLIYCTAARNLGLNELGFGYKGSGGATMRGHIQSVIHRTFPGVDTGTERRRFESMSAGDVRSWLPFQHATVAGYFPNGEGGDKMWASPGAWGGTRRGRHAQWDGYSGFTPKMALRLWFEWAHSLWPKDGFDWFLCRMRAPDQKKYMPTLYFQLDPIDPAGAKPPPIESHVYPERGFVMLRAEEGPEHWTSPAPAAALRLTCPYAHGVNDALALSGFYAFNRPIYQNPKPDPGYAFKFSRSVRSHCSVMIDGHIKKDDWGRTGSVEPGFTDDCVTRHDFNRDVKFVAARTRKRYPGIDETRALMLTREYMFDLSSARGEGRHSFVWLVHTYGRAQPDRPGEWLPSDALTNLVSELSDVRTLRNAGRDWSLTVRQVRPESEPENTRLGDAWWARKIGVRLRMLGQDDAQAHVAPTPKPYTNRKNKPPPRVEVDGVTVAVSSWGDAASFVALHEPFEGEPRVETFERIAATEDAVAVRVRGVAGSGIDDRLMLRFGDGADRPVTLGDGKERVTFTGYAFVRIAGQRVRAHGKIAALALSVPDRKTSLVVNGKPVEATVTDGLLHWEK